MLSELPVSTLSDDEYQRDRKFYIEMYRASMEQYDKLVPWAAGGALVLSVTLLHDATGTAATRSVIALSWVALFVSLTASIVGHFTSSRTYSYARGVLVVHVRKWRYPRPILIAVTLVLG